MTAVPLSDLTDALLAAARRAGAEAADAVVVRGTSVSIGVRAGALEQAERSEGVDIGLRVLMGPRQACVSASDIKPETLTEMAERAVAMAREAPEDPHCGLADPAQLATGWDLAALDLCDESPEPDPAALQAAALTAEAAALDVAGISQVEAASAGHGRRAVHLAASNGFSGGYARSDHGLSCVAITGSGTGMERDYFGDMRLHRADLMTPAEIGRRAAERTLARANARQPRTGRYPVLFDERVAASLIGHLLSAIDGTAIARGASWARGLLGQPVLPDGLDLIEDPHLPRKSGSRPFDGEGLPTARRAIVEAGMLTGWTLDLATARKLGLASTGNASRGPAAPPSPSPSNIALTQGSASPAELMRDMGTGLLVTSMIGATINPNTGDYSRGASGLWIENGAPAYAVNECTIAGNLRDMLRALIPANDARPHLSRVVPSLMVPEMTLAGA
jgi:PmbA protein